MTFTLAMNTGKIRQNLPQAKHHTNQRLFFLADKICDQVSDAVLDAHLQIDPDAKVSGGCQNFG